MKVVLFTVGVLGLAVLFGLAEPMPASGQPVTTDDVRLVSEQMAEQTPGRAFVWNARTRGKGQTFRFAHSPLR
jgi:hypothetical protein